MVVIGTTYLHPTRNQRSTSRVHSPSSLMPLRNGDLIQHGSSNRCHLRPPTLYTQEGYGVKTTPSGKRYTVGPRYRVWIEYRDGTDVLVCGSNTDSGSSLRHERKVIVRTFIRERSSPSTSDTVRTKNRDRYRHKGRPKGQGRHCRTEGIVKSGSR